MCIINIKNFNSLSIFTVSDLLNIFSFCIVLPITRKVSLSVIVFWLDRSPPSTKYVLGYAADFTEILVLKYRYSHSRSLIIYIPQVFKLSMG